MKSIQVKNFRSFQDSGKIEFNNVNLFLGKNSSGKSSILRLFPLFKQSILHELRGPFMWYDETYDFGSFSNVLSRHPSGDGKLKFLIELELPKNNCPDTGGEAIGTFPFLPYLLCFGSSPRTGHGRGRFYLLKGGNRRGRLQGYYS